MTLFISAVFPLEKHLFWDQPTIYFVLPILEPLWSASGGRIKSNRFQKT